MGTVDHSGFVDRVDRGLAWREWGTGEPVVFLHGLGGTREAWGPQLRALHPHGRCIAWDMPGYGRSAPLEPLTYAGIADRLVELLDALDVERAHLVGLSFGGMHALHTARRHPDRVGRLVLADTSPAFGLDGTTPEDWIAARLTPIDEGRVPADIAEPVLDAITAAPLVGEVRRELIAAFGRIGADGFRAAVHCLPTNDVRAELGRIDHPALVIVGELDAETPPSYAQALADGLPDARLVVLDGVGHLSPSEDPDRFNQLVRSFLFEPTATPSPTHRTPHRTADATPDLPLEQP
ncbi:MAG: alpha/beta hydrolase [Actinomycetota bacterium]